MDDKYVMVDIPKWEEYQSVKKRHNQWIKLDTNMMHDPVIRDLNSEAFRCWVGLLLWAGSVGVPFKFCPSSAGVLFGFRHSSVFYHLVDQGLITTEIPKKRREDKRKEENGAKAPTPPKVPKKKPQKTAPKKQGSSTCPEGWNPDEKLVAWCAKEFPNLAWRKELSKMKDNEFRRAYSDWSKVFRNWMRNAQDYANERGSSSGGAPTYTPPEARAPEKTDMELTIQSAKSYGLKDPESYANVNDLRKAIQSVRFGGAK